LSCGLFYGSNQWATAYNSTPSYFFAVEDTEAKMKKLAAPLLIFLSLAGAADGEVWVFDRLEGSETDWLYNSAERAGADGQSNSGKITNPEPVIATGTIDPDNTVFELIP
jgi:hypothetical protein